VLTLPPFIGAGLNTAFERDLFSGRDAADYGKDATAGQLVGLFANTLLSPIAPVRIGQRVISPRESEAGVPAWRRLLEQATPFPRPVPWSADGRRSSGSWESNGGSEGSSSGGSWQ
jgi:hypothetical protein